MMTSMSHPSADPGDTILEDGVIEGGEQQPDTDAERIAYAALLTDFHEAKRGADKVAEPELLYTAEDLALAVEEAKRAVAEEIEGELRAAMVNELDQRRCDLLALIKDQVGTQRSAFEDEVAGIAAASQRIALELAKVAVPKALEHQPFVDMVDILKGTFARLMEEPSVEVRLSQELVADGEVILAELAQEIGFAGEISAIPDPALGRGDLVLRWKGGMLERRLESLKDEALALVEQWFEDHPVVSNPSPGDLGPPISQGEVSADAQIPLDPSDQQISEPCHEC